MFESIEEKNHRHAKRLLKLQETHQRILSKMIDEHRAIDPDIYSKININHDEPDGRDLQSLIFHIGETIMNLQRSMIVMGKILNEMNKSKDNDHHDFCELETQTDPTIIRMGTCRTDYQ